MRVFLDECIDWRFSRDIVGHDVRTARQMGWSAVQNGKLLALVAEQFDVFVTVDRNLSFQQNVTTFDLAVFVLQAKTNRLLDLRTMVTPLLTAMATAKPGTCTVIRP